MKAAIIIPARFAATRLPGKLLLAQTGKPLIQHTYEQAKKSNHATAVIVATDDQRIYDVVTAFGGTAVMTAPSHETGSARIAEAAAHIQADIIINLQGDEPELDPAHIDKLIESQARSNCFASTLACPFPANAVKGPGSPDDGSAVKVILGAKLGPDVHEAAFFTRSICPYPRDAAGLIANPQNYFLHIGIYAFTPQSLRAFSKAPPAALEQSQRLEQLRILEMGEKIAVRVVSAGAPGIDTPDDYRKFVARELARARQ